MGSPRYRVVILTKLQAASQADPRPARAGAPVVPGPDNQLEH